MWLKYFISDPKRPYFSLIVDNIMASPNGWNLCGGLPSIFQSVSSGSAVINFEPNLYDIVFLAPNK